MIGDKTTIEIKGADWSTFGDIYNCPIAIVIKKHFNIPGAAVDNGKNAFAALPGDYLVVWDIEGFEGQKDCKLTLTEKSRKHKPGVCHEWFVAQGEFIAAGQRIPFHWPKAGSDTRKLMGRE